MKFSKERVIAEVELIRKGELHRSDSAVYNEWAEMATEWLINDPNTYLNDGFTGFSTRSAKQIVLDFHLGDKLDQPLTEAEYNDCMESVG